MLNKLEKPSKEDQKLAMESYDALEEVLSQLNNPSPEIKIQESNQVIKIPVNALKMLAKILDATSKGKAVSIVPRATELTTQAAADFLGVSRPYLIKILERGDIKHTLVGKHRRIKHEDLVRYKITMKSDQKNILIDMMQEDEDLGLYNE